jgi:hypothetical protein
MAKMALLNRFRYTESVAGQRFWKLEDSKKCARASLDDLLFGDDGAYLPRPKSRDGWFAGAVKRAKVQKTTPHDLPHLHILHSC